uniref:Uncharacterized protein n=1 Tax=Anguilla anguilla TaxID=7936 RepID=A0A0E9R2E5_ANGAN
MLKARGGGVKPSALLCSCLLVGFKDKRPISIDVTSLNI